MPTALLNATVSAVARILILALALAGCTPNRTNHSLLPSTSDQARLSITKPVNCSRAKQDIRVLEDEHASVARQMLAGVRSVFPISAVVGILTDDYDDRVAVATGTYNAAIEQKILEIRTTCNMN